MRRCVPPLALLLLALPLLALLPAACGSAAGNPAATHASHPQATHVGHPQAIHVGHPQATHAGRPQATQKPHPNATATIDGCLTTGPGTRAITLHPHGSAIKAVLVGTGTTTFVLSNESDQNLCGWLPFVRVLKAHHYSALLYDYLDPAELADDALAGARAARAAGAKRIVLMGASVGARASIEAAASAAPGLTAAVSLSAERSVSSDPSDLVRRARHVTIPTLLISARDDPFVDGATVPLLRALAGKRKQALILPGTDHGTSLLTDSNRRRVEAAIFRFVSTSS